MGFFVSIMGQTGVGKTSLLNAIFNLNLPTSATKPTTTPDEPEIVIPGPQGDLRIRDLPGLGESPITDDKYLQLYREQLLKSDIVIWAVHADSRSVSFDQIALQRLLEGLSVPEKEKILSKITIVLTKVDLLTPPPWIFSRQAADGIFVPDPILKSILDAKTEYFTRNLILPFEKHVWVSTYNDTELSKSPVAKLAIDKFSVRHHGLVTREIADDFYRDRAVAKNPKLQGAVERLYRGSQVIACSALFRFNLAQLMTVIVSKLGPQAMGPFGKFTEAHTLNRVPFEEAKRYRNIVVVDQATQRVAFDLAHYE